MNLTQYVVGQFAAAIIDHARRQVVLLQDSLGVRQLFYSSTSETLYFSNKLEELARTIECDTLDMEYFADLLAKASVCTERTPYQRVHRLRFGKTLVWKAGRYQLSNAWDPSRSLTPVIKNESEYEEQLLERLYSAVAGAVRADEKTWCHLSGGLDSTSVLMTAISLGKEVDALTFIDPLEEDFDDTKVSAAVVRQIHIPWHTIDARQHLPFSGFSSECNGEPGTETHGSRRDYYFRLLETNDVDVVLTGIGGDVAFGSPDWPSYEMVDALKQLRLPTFLRAFGYASRHDPQRRSWTHRLTNEVVKPLYSHLRKRRIGRGCEFIMLPSWIDSRFSKEYGLRSRLIMHETPRHPAPGRNALWEEAYIQAADTNSGYNIRASVDFRHPLLDRNLLEFMFSIPYQQRQRPQQDRYLQRRALDRLLPEIVLKRRIKGSGQCLYDEGLRSSTEWFDILYDDPFLARLGLVDKKLWKSEVERARFGLYESLPHFAIAACIECWFRCKDHTPGGLRV